MFWSLGHSQKIEKCKTCAADQRSTFEIAIIFCVINGVHTIVWKSGRSLLDAAKTRGFRTCLFVCSPVFVKGFNMVSSNKEAFQHLSQEI